jgi:hypothetical protein
MRENVEPTLWDYKTISRITELKYSTKPILNEVANVADFKLWQLLKLFCDGVMAVRVDNELAWVPVSIPTTSILFSENRRHLKVNYMPHS